MDLIQGRWYDVSGPVCWWLACSQTCLISNSVISLWCSVSAREFILLMVASFRLKIALLHFCEWLKTRWSSCSSCAKSWKSVKRDYPREATADRTLLAAASLWILHLRRVWSSERAQSLRLDRNCDYCSTLVFVSRCRLFCSVSTTDIFRRVVALELYIDWENHFSSLSTCRSWEFSLR